MVLFYPKQILFQTIHIMTEHQTIDHINFNGHNQRWKSWDSICALFLRMGVQDE